MPLPDGAELLSRERRCRPNGSGIDPADLIGHWQLTATWPRNGDRPARLAGTLLQALGARLSLTAGATAQELQLANRVGLGALELRFVGRARLEGRRPLLLFRFDRLLLRLGSLTLLEKPLAQPLDFARQRPGELPFFALIACERDGHRSEGQGVDWLAARGRGGGLALWCRDGAPRPGAATLPAAVNGLP